MATCSRCGAELPEGTKYCPGCGQPAQEGVPQPPPPPPGTVPSPIPGSVPPPPGPPGAIPAPVVPVAAPRPAKKGMSRGGKIAIIVGISAVVLIAAVIGVAIFLLVGAIKAPADVSNKYLQALNDGDLSTAWGYISKDTQKEETRSGFISDKESFKGEIDSYNTSGVEVSNGNARVEMDIEFKDGKKATWEISLIKENGKWKINSIIDH
ncbi:MAG: DUF4878 domain-containing protein [Actinobacteria bacterium]|nr:DUF4878 domain-containing protein [Actinomycetota bacterium]MBU4218531.1 DUF4878 domain-containing protein [Actinomycetota bacterium]MBU4403121.1 DUF4878 domain-containing protein [Actinomycetota bacterium]MCG2819720.1 DUF4878 domain-containing protein [Actinomycetes bacterium]